MVFAFCGEIEALSPDDNVNGSVKNFEGASAYHDYQRRFPSPPCRVTGSMAPGHEGEDLVSGKMLICPYVFVIEALNLTRTSLIVMQFVSQPELGQVKF